MIVYEKPRKGATHIETLDRVALMRKTLPDLRHMIRRLGGDSPNTEGKDSLVSRILMFQPQKWEQEKPKTKIPVIPVTEQDLFQTLKPYILRGLKLHVDDGSWYATIKDRKDSGSLCMPLATIERSVRYLMPKDT